MWFDFIFAIETRGSQETKRKEKIFAKFNQNIRDGVCEMFSSNNLKLKGILNFLNVKWKRNSKLFSMCDDSETEKLLKIKHKIVITCTSYTNLVWRRRWLRHSTSSER